MQDTLKGRNLDISNPEKTKTEQLGLPQIYKAFALDSFFQIPYDAVYTCGIDAEGNETDDKEKQVSTKSVTIPSFRYASSEEDYQIIFDRECILPTSARYMDSFPTYLMNAVEDNYCDYMSYRERTYQVPELLDAAKWFMAWMVGKYKCKRNENYLQLAKVATAEKLKNHNSTELNQKASLQANGLEHEAIALLYFYPVIAEDEGYQVIDRPLIAKEALEKYKPGTSDKVLLRVYKRIANQCLTNSKLLVTQGRTKQKRLKNMVWAYDHINGAKFPKGKQLLKEHINSLYKILRVIPD